MRIVFCRRGILGTTIIGIKFRRFGRANGLNVFLGGGVEIDDHCFGVRSGFFSSDCFVVEGVCDDALVEGAAG